MNPRFNIIKLCLWVFCLCAVAGITMPPRAYAQGYIICIPCIFPSTCTDSDCDNSADEIDDYRDEASEDYLSDNDHSDTEDTGDDFNGQLEDFEQWIVNFSREQIVPAMQKMTTQLSAVAMKQMFILGTFFDAQMQLKTQRLLQTMQAQAHRDYQPSEDFCWFGTNVRSLAATEARSRYHSQALNARQMARHLGNVNQAGAETEGHDKSARWKQFTEVYCDPQDNNWNGNEGSGLESACGVAGGGDTDRINLDIDYTRLIDHPRTREVNFTASEDREDVLALGNNLYGHDVLTRNLDSDYMDREAYQGLYLALRSVAARRNVAENSYNAIVELKTAGTSDLPHKISHTREFMAAILTEMGVPDDEAYEYLGERPSYYAQLELLAKKIYQNPDFYANLYDKPANVARKGVALKAIELMLDRAIYESQLRREMATSVLLSTKLHLKQKGEEE